MTAGTNGQTHNTCQGFIQNDLVNYCCPLFSAYSQGIDRWEAFTNSGTGPIRINLTSLSLNTGDQVRIYNGVGTAGALLATYINTVTSLGNFVTAPSGTITVRFTTNTDGAVGGGFSAIIGCRPSGCSGNNPAGDTCTTSTRICDTSPYCGNTGGWYTADHENIDVTGTGTFCGSIENNSWIVFTANTTNASFRVDVANCASSASGIQMQMYATNCTTFTAVSPCINQNTAPTSFTLSSNVSLTPGTDYNLMIDGFAGNYCNYTVTPLVGAQVATISITSNTLCSGQTSTLTLSGAVGGSTYSWAANTAGSISGSSTNSFVIITPTTNTTYSVTINQPNGCAIDTYTRSIIVNPVPPITSANTTTVCSGSPLAFGLSSSIPSSFSWIAADNPNTNGESTSAVSSGIINNTIINTSTVTQSVIYSVTPTSSLGSCVGATQILTVSVIPLPSPTITSSSSLCLGSSITFTGTGASTYTWSTGGGGGLSLSSGSIVSATPSATGTINYTANVTSASGCINTAVKSVTVNPLPIANSGLGVNLTCSFLSAALSGSGGGTYSWSGPGITAGATSASPTVNLPGTYSLSVTSAAGCTSTISTVSVTQNTTAPTISASNSSTLSCSTTTAALTGTGGGSYAWSGPGISSGAATSSPIVNLPGTYNLTVTAANGCTATANTSITQNATLPIVTSSSTGSLNCTSLSVNAIASTTTAPVSYNWSGAGITAGATTATITVNQPGTYNYTVTNTSNGCIATGSQNITQNISAPSVSGANTGTLNCATLNINASATTSTTPVSYNWSGPGISSGSATGTITVNQPGTYNYTVTNTSNGCTTTGLQTISQNTTAPTVTVSGTQTITCASPTVTMIGSATPSTCTPVWSGGVSSGANSFTATAASSNVYTLTVTNPANGCVVSKTVSVLPSAGFPNLSVPAISNSITCSTGTAQAVVTTTTSNVSFNWTGTGIIGSTNTPTIIVNTGGTYSLAVTNTISLCTSSITAFVPTNTTAPIPTAANTTTLTCSVNTATLTGGPATGVTYQWSGPGFSGGTTSQNATAVVPGTYSLLVISSVNSCSAIATTVVSQNTLAPIPSASNTTTLTCAINTIALTGSPASGVTYQWSGPGFSGGTTSQIATANAPGSYSLLVTSSINSCTAIATTSVTQNITLPIPSASNTTTLTCSTTTASLIGGPASGVTYQWSGPSFSGGTTSQNATANAPGTYSLLVTSSVNSCTAIATTSVAQNITPPIVTASNSSTLNCYTPSASLTGTGGGNYAWSGPGIVSGAATASPTVNLPGTYNLTVTAANGCKATANTSITQNTTTPTVAGSTTGTLTCSTLTVNAIATTTTAPESYNWAGPSILSGVVTATITIDAPGTYTYIVTDVTNGCIKTGTVAVIQNTIAPATVASTTGSITCVNNTVNLSASLAGMNYTWTAPSGSSILSGTTLQNAVGQGLGTYSLSVLSPINGCAYQTTVAAIQNTTTPTSVDAGPNQTLICVTPTLSLLGSATPSTSIANWLGVVSNPSTFTTSTGAAGVYTLQAINPTTGCYITDIVTVNQSVNSPTVTSNLVTNSITCTNSVVAIGVSVISADPISITWPIGTGISGPTNTLTTTATLTGVYQVTVTNTSNGCISINSINVPIDQSPIVANISPTSTITCNTPSLTLNASPVGSNYSFSWTGSGTILSGGASPNPIINSGGTYSVAITNTVNGCVGNATIAVASDTVIPVVNIAIPSVTTTCGNPTATITAVSSPSTGVSYSWSPPSTGTLNSYTISNPIASGSGIFTVVVTNQSSGCSSSLTQNTVEVIPDLNIPITTLSATSASITCSNPTPSVTITTSSPVTYSWSPSSGIVSGTENTATPSFSATGSYSVVVTNTTTGCATSANTNVVDVYLDNTIPVISLSSAVNDGTITCGNTSVIVTPSVSPSSNLTYTWTSGSGSGLSSPINQASATFTAAGIYTLAVTNTLTGCVSSSTNTANTFTVYSNTNTPTVSVVNTSTNNVIGCANATVTFSANVTSVGNNLNYNWSNGSTTDNANITTAGVYSVVVTDAVTSCSTSAQFTVNGNTTPPQNVNAGSVIYMACGSSSVALNGTSTSTNVTYSWNGPSGTSVTSGSNTANPTVTDIGTYTLTVTDNLTGCQSTATVNVAQSNVTASFNADPTTGVSPLIVNFTNTSNGATNYSWNFGDSNSSNQTNPSNTYSTGSYTVILTATAGTCVSTATTVIVVEDDLSIEIPNVFTPNNDGSNDVFTIKSTGVKEISLQVFNRWGEKLYEFVGPKASWDGFTTQGAKVPEGTYFFFVKATGFDNKEIEKHGTLTLFR